MLNWDARNHHLWLDLHLQRIIHVFTLIWEDACIMILQQNYVDTCIFDDGNIFWFMKRNKCIANFSISKWTTYRFKSNKLPTKLHLHVYIYPTQECCIFTRLAHCMYHISAEMLSNTQKRTDCDDFIKTEVTYLEIWPRRWSNLQLVSPHCYEKHISLRASLNGVFFLIGTFLLFLFDMIRVLGIFWNLSIILRKHDGHVLLSVADAVISPKGVQNSTFKLFGVQATNECRCTYLKILGMIYLYLPNCIDTCLRT